MINPIACRLRFEGLNVFPAVADVEIVGGRVFVALNNGKVLSGAIGADYNGWDMEYNFNARFLFPYRDFSSVCAKQYLYLIGAAEVLRLEVDTDEVRKIALKPPFGVNLGKTDRLSRFFVGRPIGDYNGKLWLFMNGSLPNDTETTWAVSYDLPDLSPNSSRDLGCLVSDTVLGSPVAVSADRVYYLDGETLVRFNYADGSKERRQMGERVNICAAGNEVYAAGRLDVYHKQEKYNPYFEPLISTHSLLGNVGYHIVNKARTKGKFRRI